MISQSLSPTGSADIDSQHDALLALERQAVAALKTGSDEAAIDALEALCERFSTHFAFEDQLMVASGDVSAGEHRRDHERFLNDLAAIVTRARIGGEDGRTAVALWLDARVSGWARYHVRSHDVPLARRLAAMPATATA
jgi:hemerythrin-like metal-binding protein